MSPQASAPIVIAEIAVGNEIVRVELKEWNGRQLFSAWRFYRDKTDELRPGRHGLSFSIDRLPEIAKAFASALEEARRRGLISGGAE
jgi:hypothetical protein